MSETPKTPEEINAVRRRLRERLTREPMNEPQRVMLWGMLVMAVWCAGGPASTVDRLLSDESLADYERAEEGLATMRELERQRFGRN